MTMAHVIAVICSGFVMVGMRSAKRSMKFSPLEQVSFTQGLMNGMKTSRRSPHQFSSCYEYLDISQGQLAELL